MTSLAYAKEQCSTTSQIDEVLETQVITTDVPSHLKGAKIIVRRADGKESEVPAELFKVVPRRQQRIVTKLESKRVVSCKETLFNKNRISLLGGYGAQEGTKRRVTEDSVRLQNNVGAVGGLQYQRSLNERWSFGAQGQTNETGSVMIGLDF